MMNKKMWGGETRPNYVAPSFEEFNVAVEEGFAVSEDPSANNNPLSFGGWKVYGDNEENTFSE